MSHIHTNAGEHDLTVSAFVIRDDSAEPRLLLHMHKKLHVLLQIGGHVEVNENPWQAIEHELREESGYAFDELEVLQPKDRLRSLANTALHPSPIAINTHNFDPDGNHKHTDISFAFVAHGDPSLAPEDGESNDLRWLSAKQLAELKPTEIFENVREIGQYVLNHAYIEWERISTHEV